MNDRRRARALKRQNRGYPGVWNVRTVEDADWMSQLDAADALGVSQFRLAFMVAARRIEPAHNAKRQAGVSIESVGVERAWRDDAGAVGRSVTLAADFCTAGFGLPAPRYPRKR